MKILSLNISSITGTIKHPVDHIRLTASGMEGDAHAGTWNRQVSMLGIESIRRFEPTLGRQIGYGEFAENITTEGMELWKVHPLDRFKSGEVDLEVTQIGKSCHGEKCTIFKEVGNCVMPKEGIFCRIVHPGILGSGDDLEYHPKIYKIHVITLSDRAAGGVYEDKSGPQVKELMEQFFSALHLSFSIIISLIPDDPEKLRSLVNKLKEDKVDLIITTGGTGIGPRDFTPDVIKPLLEKEIPGIMEMIRLKYGKEKPHALLSRSIAGVLGETLVYCLPGSVKAVREYMNEILPSLMHSIYMLHGLDAHL